MTFWNNPCQGMAFESLSAQMQSALEQKPETDMENSYQRKPEIFETLEVRSDSTTNDTHFGRRHRMLKAFKQLFEPQPDLNRLSPQLRKDAGINEQALERSTIVKAPLIR
jgi:hypothetical protein